MDRARRRTCEAILELALDSSTTPEQTLLCTQLLDRAVSKKPRKACIGFDLSTWPGQTCVDYFRFHKIDIPVLAAALHLPEVVRVPRSRYSAPRVEALCIVLRHLAYPIRLMDLASLFGRTPSAVSEIGNYTLVWLYEHWEGLLLFDTLGLSSRAADFSAAVKAKSDGAVDGVIGFIDGTGRPIARPVVDQREVFSGHHRRHELSYQAVVNPDGIVRSFFGPVPGKRIVRIRSAQRCGLLPQRS